MASPPNRKIQHRRKAAAAAALDCATAFQKMALDCVAAIKARHSRCLRRRCRGRASDPGRDHAVARRRGVLCADRGRCGVAAPAKQEIAWLNGPLGAARDSDVVVEYARRKRYRAWAQRMVGERSISARCRTTVAWFAACVPFVRNACFAAMAAGSGKDRGWSAISGTRTRKLLQSYCCASSTVGTSAWSARDGT